MYKYKKYSNFNDGAESSNLPALAASGLALGGTALGGGYLLNKYNKLNNSYKTIAATANKKPNTKAALGGLALAELGLGLGVEGVLGKKIAENMSGLQDQIDVLNAARGIPIPQVLHNPDILTNSPLIENIGKAVSNAFSYSDTPSYTAKFASPIGVGAAIGAVKGALDQPNEMMVDNATGEIINRSYNPVERIGAVGLNAAVGAGLGYGGQRLGLIDPYKLGRYMGNVQVKGRQALNKARNYLPEISIEYV